MDGIVGSRVLVKPIIQEEGEVVLFKATEDQGVEGEVVISSWEDLLPGSIVIFNKYAGHEVEIEGVKHKILFIDNGIDSEVLGVKKWIKPEVKKEGAENA